MCSPDLRLEAKKHHPYHEGGPTPSFGALKAASSDHDGSGDTGHSLLAAPQGGGMHQARTSLFEQVSAFHLSTTITKPSPTLLPKAPDSLSLQEGEHLHPAAIRDNDNNKPSAAAAAEFLPAQQSQDWPPGLSAVGNHGMLPGGWLAGAAGAAINPSTLEPTSLHPASQQPSGSLQALALPPGDLNHQLSQQWLQSLLSGSQGLMSSGSVMEPGGVGGGPYASIHDSALLPFGAETVPNSNIGTSTTSTTSNNQNRSHQNQWVPPPAAGAPPMMPFLAPPSQSTSNHLSPAVASLLLSSLPGTTNFEALLALLASSNASPSLTAAPLSQDWMLPPPGSTFAAPLGVPTNFRRPQPSTTLGGVGSSIATAAPTSAPALAPPPDSRPSSPMVRPVGCVSDGGVLSEYQRLLRAQMEYFEATSDDVNASAQGRNRPIRLGQVGIRCRHCGAHGAPHRPRGSVYYPARLLGVYQSAQNMGINHFAGCCPHLDPAVLVRLRELRETKAPLLHGGGKKYWAARALEDGIVETDHGLVYNPAAAARAGVRDSYTDGPPP